jgi:hypothetical protein
VPKSNLLFNDFGQWNAYLLLGISVMYIIMYSINYFNQYLTIDNDIIKENHPFGKKIKLTELKNIKKFAGDYILKTEKTKLTINTQIIDEKSLEELNLILDRQNLELN